MEHKDIISIGEYKEGQLTIVSERNMFNNVVKMMLDNICKDKNLNVIFTEAIDDFSTREFRTNQYDFFFITESDNQYNFYQYEYFGKEKKYPERVIFDVSRLKEVDKETFFSYFDEHKEIVHCKERLLDYLDKHELYTSLKIETDPVPKMESKKRSKI
jgi:hypothetical protein